jgi:hypothetical protein
MQSVLPIAGALLVLLEVAGSITDRTKWLLPIGGSHVSQMAVVFGSAFVVHEFIAVLSQ